MLVDAGWSCVSGQIHGTEIPEEVLVGPWHDTDLVYIVRTEHDMNLQVRFLIELVTFGTLVDSGSAPVDNNLAIINVHHAQRKILWH